MDNTAKHQPQPPKEPSFDLTITNGAAKILQSVKEKLGKDSAKEVVSLGLQILDYALSQEADLIIKKKNGGEERIILKENSNGNKEGNS